MLSHFHDRVESADADLSDTRVPDNGFVKLTCRDKSRPTPRGDSSFVPQALVAASPVPMRYVPKRWAIS